MIIIRSIAYSILFFSISCFGANSLKEFLSKTSLTGSLLAELHYVRHARAATVSEVGKDERGREEITQRPKYSAVQRGFFQDRSDGAIVALGMLLCSNGGFIHIPTVGKAFNLTTEDDPYAFAMQAVVPLEAYMICKTAVDAVAPGTDAMRRKMGSVVGAFVLSHGIARTGVSSSSIVLNMYAYSLARKFKNGYRDSSYNGVRDLADSFETAATVVPVMRGITGLFYKQPSLYTLQSNPEEDSSGLGRDLVHCIVPLAVHTAVGFAGRQLAKTAAGTFVNEKFDAAVDTVVTPLPLSVQPSTKWALKHGAVNLVQWGASVAMIQSAQSLENGCTLL